MDYAGDISYKGPVYIRLGNNREEHYLDNPVFERGKPSIVRNGKDLTIFTTGTILNEVMKVYEMLKTDGVEAEIISVHTLKPMETKAIAKLASKTKRIVVVEEHNIISGLYSALTEALVEEQTKISILKIGLEDVFAKDYGNLENVRRANKIDSHAIFERVKHFLESK